MTWKLFSKNWFFWFHPHSDCVLILTSSIKLYHIFIGNARFANRWLRQHYSKMTGECIINNVVYCTYSVTPICSMSCGKSVRQFSCSSWMLFGKIWVSFFTVIFNTNVYFNFSRIWRGFDWNYFIQRLDKTFSSFFKDQTGFINSTCNSVFQNCLRLD